MRYFLKHTLILVLMLFSTYDSFSQNLFVNGDFQSENLDNYTPNVQDFCSQDGVPDCPSASIDNGYYNPAGLGGYECTSAFPRVDGWDPVVNHAGWAIPFYECAGGEVVSGVCPSGVAVNRCNRHGIVNTLPPAETVSLDENNFVGLRTYGAPNSDNQYHDIRAYLTGKLRTPLVAGQTYKLSFYMMLASGSAYTTKGIQWKFSQAPLQVPHSADASGDPQTKAQWSLATSLNNDNGNNNPSGGVDDLRVTDQENWTLVTACYTAVGGEEYFTIGNFMLDSDIDPQPNPHPTIPDQAPPTYPGNPQAYYFFDDFSLVPLSLNATSTEANCGVSDGTIVIDADDLFIPGDSYNVTYKQDGTTVGPISITANANGELVITGLAAGIYTDITVEGTCDITYAGPVEVTQLDNCNTICDGDTISESTSGYYTGAGFEQIYVLVNLTTGNIVASNSTGTFTQLDYGAGNLGDYEVYAVNTNDAGVIAEMHGTGSWATAQANADLACADISTPVPITIAHCCDLLVTDVSVTNESCDGYNDGEINITISGNSQYDIFVNGDTIPVFDDVPEGTYTLDNLQDTTYIINITDIIPGVEGTPCDTVFNVDVNQGLIINVDAGPDQTVCYGEQVTLTAEATPNTANIIWSNNVTDGLAFTPSVSATYTVIASLNGCSDTDVVNINVNPLPTIDAGENIDICEGDSATLTATSPSSATDFIWNNGLGNGNTHTVSPTSTTTYTVTVTDNNSCENIDSVTVNVHSLPVSDLTTQDVSCYGLSDGSIDLTVSGGTPPYDFKWNNGQTTEDINNLSADTYTVTVNDSYNCSSVDSARINEPNPLIADLPDDFTHCNGSGILSPSVTGGTPPYTYLWSTGETSENINYDTLHTNNYVLTVTDINGCISQDDVTVTIVDVKLNVRASAGSVCPGDPVRVNTEIIGGVAPYSIYNNGQLVTYPIIVYPNNEGHTTLKIVDACGNVDDTILNINIYPVPTINFNADVTKGCTPLTVHFNEENNLKNATYHWDFGSAGFNYGNTSSPVHVFEEPGNYDVGLEVITSKGCKTYKKEYQMITVYPKPVARFEASPEVVSFIDPEIRFINLSTDNYNNYWNFGDSYESSEISPFHKYEEVGDYLVSLTVESEYGCKDSVKHSVRVKDEFTLYVPTAFSPDGDGINDKFIVKGHGLDLDSYYIAVYDRWGEVIWESSDFYNYWDGNDIKMRKPVKTGIYKWLIICKDFNGAEHKKSGNITVIR